MYISFAGRSVSIFAAIVIFSLFFSLCAVSKNFNNKFSENCYENNHNECSLARSRTKQQAELLFYYFFSHVSSSLNSLIYYYYYHVYMWTQECYRTEKIVDHSFIIIIMIYKYMSVFVPVFTILLYRVSRPNSYLHAGPICI